MIGQSVRNTMKLIYILEPSDNSIAEDNIAIATNRLYHATVFLMWETPINLQGFPAGLLNMVDLRHICGVF